MKLSLVTLALAAVSAAQNIRIRRPRPGASVVGGGVVSVVVQTPTNGSQLHEVSLILSILPCPNDNCPNAGNNLGTILYEGPFHPQGAPIPEQTLNVTVPESVPLGTAELLATHFVLVGGAPTLQIAGEVVYVDSD
ncbi:hypothetical protein E4U42_001293 [Claviceps africana]|uniref:Uncharacterized protein n=1 Tax=Claviceps africana TaxID=83212 RepID=A0A8K0IZP0_9HYPO|nr:hypothetical protein E4U42_001293 [Claviceps africana]